MKANKLSIIFSIFFTLILTSCFNPVFYEIRKDVPPEPATFECPINSLARYSVGTNEYLVAPTNDGISYKDAKDDNHGSWRTFGTLPFELHRYNSQASEHSGEQIINVSANNSTLYILSAKYEPDDDLGLTKIKSITLWGIQITTLSEDGISWVAPSVGWTKIIEDTNNTYFPIYEYNEYYHSAFNIISTNAPIKEHRKVYIRKGNVEAERYNTDIKYFELNGLEVPSETEPLTFVDPNSNNCANSVMYFDGDYYFLNAKAYTTNESYETDATRFYFSDGSHVKSNDPDNPDDSEDPDDPDGSEDPDNPDGSEDPDDPVVPFKIKEETLDAKSTISSLAYCTDALLIGRGDFNNTNNYGNGGIAKANITNGELSTTLSSFSTNAEFQLPSSYYVPIVLNATPGSSEKDSNLYATSLIYGSNASSSASYKNVGLWSYYPGRGNWNRE